MVFLLHFPCSALEHQGFFIHSPIGCGRFCIYLSRFEWGFWQSFDHKNGQAVQSKYPGFDKRIVNSSTIPPAYSLGRVVTNIIRSSGPTLLLVHLYVKAIKYI